MKNKGFVITVLIFITLIVYLFVNAPPPIPEETDSGLRLPTRLVLKLANEENKQARALYTKEIVQAGKKQGLKFDEDWQEQHVIAGPLPAQFLRETATHLEKSPVRLGLYLGSDFPINKVNQLAGEQLKHFNNLKIKREDVYFHLAQDQTYVYMSPDVAIASACVDCHNEHKQTPKDDWKLKDVMGATTWLYPTDTISLSDAISLLAELRKGFAFAYQYALDEFKQLPNPPQVGDRWPAQGYYLPTLDVFVKELNKRASTFTLAELMLATNKTQKEEGNAKDSN